MAKHHHICALYILFVLLGAHAPTLGIRAISQASEDGQSTDTSGGAYEVQVISDIQLPDDGTSDVPMTADLYFAKQLRSQLVPLVILAPGAAGAKELFSQASSNLARAGFATLVLSQLRPVPEPVAAMLGVDASNGLNFARPHIVQQALAWAQEASTSAPDASVEYPLLDADNIYLLGHSYGAYLIMVAADGRLPPFLYAPLGMSDDAAPLREPLRPLPGVQGIFLYGWTLEDQFGMRGTFDDSYRKATLPPLCALFGAFDYLVNGTHGTFERLPPPKAVTVINNLDHFSISDTAWLSRNETSSTLPRAEQVKRVTDAAAAWFRTLRALEGNNSTALSNAVSSAALLLPYIREYYGDLQQL